MVNKKNSSKGECKSLSENDKKILEEMRDNRAKNEAYMKLLREHINALKLRVEETNKKMFLLVRN
jgi:hypothetical protein